MTRSLQDKVIIITGASTGIGAATALACAGAGMNLVLTSRRHDLLEQVARSVRDAGRGAVVVPGDVTSPGMSQRLLDAAQAEYGRFDVVFANAGYGLTKFVTATTMEEERRMFDVNFFAAVDLLRSAAQRLMEEDRPGHLLMCSSCLSKFALPRQGAYSATKAAQNAVCSAMRLELRPRKIYVSSVHPITTRTEFFEMSSRLSGVDNPTRANVPDHAPRMFIQPPERVAKAVVKCLRRPRPEVWTSHIVRTVAGFMTMFPRFYDWSLRSHDTNAAQGTKGQKDKGTEGQRDKGTEGQSESHQTK